MKHIIFVALLMILGSCDVDAQTTIKILVQNSNTKEPLSAATAKLTPLNKTAIADSLGILVFEKVPNGTYTLSVSYIGFADKTISITTTLVSDTVIHILLEENEEEEEEEVIVTATRISRTIANTPTRTEVISGEELTEKGNMKPGDIRKHPQPLSMQVSAFRD
jgi:iron complex outermembrane receptor protein